MTGEGEKERTKDNLMDFGLMNTDVSKTWRSFWARRATLEERNYGKGGKKRSRRKVAEEDGPKSTFLTLQSNTFSADIPARNENVPKLIYFCPVSLPKKESIT